MMALGDKPLTLEDALSGGNLAELYWFALKEILGGGDDNLARFAMPCPPEDFDPRGYIASHIWTPAKTAVRNPHEYVVMKRSNDWQTHLAFLEWIRLSSVTERFWGKVYRCRRVDDYVYWSLGPNDSIINRRYVGETLPF